MKMTSYILAVITYFICISVSAHKDTIIRFEYGKLIGLPEEYQPAILSLDKRSIQIGSKSVTIPKCIWDRFGKVKEKDILVHSSWYHDKTMLPAYIVIEVKKDKRQDNYYELNLNLNTLEIISFEETIRTPTSERSVAVNLSAECLRDWKVKEME